MEVIRSALQNFGLSNLAIFGLRWGNLICGMKQRQCNTHTHTHKLPLLKLFFSISSKPLTLLPEKDEG